MKKFELLRPLPNVEVGTIFEECLHYDDVTRITNAFSSQDNLYEFEMSIVNDKTWFRELTEPIDSSSSIGEYMTIPLSRYEYYVERDEWLTALEHAGVDNWEGFDYAKDLLHD